jgi:hypothetical protein
MKTNTTAHTGNPNTCDGMPDDCQACNDSRCPATGTLGWIGEDCTTMYGPPNSFDSDGFESVGGDHHFEGR